jgi:hypothetical protein
VELGPGYKFVSDTFLQDEKCNLQTITFFTEFSEPHVAVSKKSAFKEILAVRSVQIFVNKRTVAKGVECCGCPERKNEILEKRLDVLPSINFKLLSQIQGNGESNN